MRLISGFKEGQSVFLLTGETVIVKEILILNGRVLYQIVDKFNVVSECYYEELCESIFDLAKKLIDSGTDLSEIKNIVNKILK